MHPPTITPADSTAYRSIDARTLTDLDSRPAPAPTDSTTTIDTWQVGLAPNDVQRMLTGVGPLTDRFDAETTKQIAAFVERQLIYPSPFNEVLSLLEGAESKTEALAILDHIQDWQQAIRTGEDDRFGSLRCFARVRIKGVDWTSEKRLGWLQEEVGLLRARIENAPDGTWLHSLPGRRPEGAWAVAQYLKDVHGISSPAELESVGFPSRALRHFDAEGNFAFSPSRPAHLDPMAPGDPHDVVVLLTVQKARTLGQFIHQLPPGRKVVIATGEGLAYDKEELPSALRRNFAAMDYDSFFADHLAGHSNIVIFDGTPGKTAQDFLNHRNPDERAIFVDRRAAAHHQYARDYGIGLKNNADGRLAVLVPHQFGGDAQLDWATLDVLSAEGLTDTHRTDLSFEGGNLFVDDRFGFVGKDTITENMECLGLTESQVVQAFEKELGRPIIVMPQQDYHLDVFMLPLGMRTVDGETKPTVLWRTDASKPTLHANGLDGIAQLESKGYRVVTVDGPAGQSPTNAFIDGTTFYVADRLTQESVTALARLGFLSLVQLPDTNTDGGLHCLTLP